MTAIAAAAREGRDVKQARGDSPAERREDDECWPWTGHCSPRGYGSLTIAGKTRQASHVAVYIDNGEWPEPGKHVCHTCDTPRCVNPAHLWVGTRSDNMQDMLAKGRSRWKVPPAETRPRGEQHWISRKRAALKDVADV